MIVGYARVSTDGQSLEAQQANLKAAGAERISSEKISGAISDRKALAQAIKALGTGDILLVTRLDRLARSTRISSTPSARLGLSSNPSPIAGQIRLRHMAS
jgi:DNA invertase Pin-like site-specific DNA recombinase